MLSLSGLKLNKQAKCSSLEELSLFDHMQFPAKNVNVHELLAMSLRLPDNYNPSKSSV